MTAVNLPVKKRTFPLSIAILLLMLLLAACRGVDNRKNMPVRDHSSHQHSDRFWHYPDSLFRIKQMVDCRAWLQEKAESAWAQGDRNVYFQAIAKEVYASEWIDPHFPSEVLQQLAIKQEKDSSYHWFYTLLQAELLWHKSNKHHQKAYQEAANRQAELYDTVISLLLPVIDLITQQPISDNPPPATVGDTLDGFFQWDHMAQLHLFKCVRLLSHMSVQERVFHPFMAWNTDSFQQLRFSQRAVYWRDSLLLTFDSVHSATYLLYHGLQQLEKQLLERQNHIGWATLLKFRLNKTLYLAAETGHEGTLAEVIGMLKNLLNTVVPHQEAVGLLLLNILDYSDFFQQTHEQNQSLLQCIADYYPYYNNSRFAPQILQLQTEITKPTLLISYPEEGVSGKMSPAMVEFFAVDTLYHQWVKVDYETYSLLQIWRDSVTINRLLRGHERLAAKGVTTQAFPLRKTGLLGEKKWEVRGMEWLGEPLSPGYYVLFYSDRPVMYQSPAFAYLTHHIASFMAVENTGMANHHYHHLMMLDCEGGTPLPHKEWHISINDRRYRKYVTDERGMLKVKNIRKGWLSRDWRAHWWKNHIYDAYSDVWFYRYQHRQYRYYNNKYRWDHVPMKIKDPADPHHPEMNVFQSTLRYKTYRLSLFKRKAYRYQDRRQGGRSRPFIKKKDDHWHRLNLTLWSDRMIYREGDTIHVKGILQHFKPQWKGREVKLVVTSNPSPTPYDSVFTCIVNEWGSISFSFIPSDKGFETGKLQCYVLGRNLALTVEVAEYKAPSFDIRVDMDHNTMVFGDSITLGLETRFYSGAVMGGSVCDANIRFQHNKGSMTSSAFQSRSLRAITDANGKGKLVFALPERGESPTGAVEVSVQLNITTMLGESQTKEWTFYVKDIDRQQELVLNRPAVMDISDTLSISLRQLSNTGLMLPPIADLYIEKRADDRLFFPGQFHVLQVRTDSLYHGDSLQQLWPDIALRDVSVGSTQAETVMRYHLEAKDMFPHLRYQPQSPGWYRIVSVYSFRFKDRLVHDTVFSDIFVLNSKEHMSHPGKGLAIAETRGKKAVYAGDSLELAIQTGDERVTHLWVYDHDQPVVALKTHKGFATYKTIAAPVNGNQHHIQVLMVCQGRVFTEKFSVDILKTPKPTAGYEWQFFKDSALAGEKVQVKLRFYEADGSPMPMEVLATMYDLSLDKLKDNSWKNKDFYTPSRWITDPNRYKLPPKLPENRSAMNMLSGKIKESVLIQPKIEIPDYVRHYTFVYLSYDANPDIRLIRQETFDPYANAFYPSYSRTLLLNSFQVVKAHRTSFVHAFWIKWVNKNYLAYTYHHDFKYSATNAHVQFRGNRLDGTAYYVDGIRTLPTRSLSELAVITAGVSSQPGASYQWAYGSETTSEERRENDDAATDKPEPSPMSGVIFRGNYRGTAFFYPHLQTDTHGVVNLSFNAPEKLSVWNMRFVAHQPNGKQFKGEKTITTYRPFFIQSAYPSFVREKDSGTIYTYIYQQQEQKEKILLRFEYLDADTDTLIGAEYRTMAPTGFGITAGFHYHCPIGISRLYFRVAAVVGDESDGEEMTLPVLPLYQQVEESVTFMMTTGTMGILPDLKGMKDGDTALLQVMTSPLPLIIKGFEFNAAFPHECSEQLANRILGNQMVYAMVNDSRYTSTIQEWCEWSRQIGSYGSYRDDMRSMIPQVLCDCTHPTQQQNILRQVKKDVRQLLKNNTQYLEWPWFEGMGYHSQVSMEVMYTLLLMHVSGQLPRELYPHLERQHRRLGRHIRSATDTLSGSRWRVEEVVYLYSYAIISPKGEGLKDSLAKAIIENMQGELTAMTLDEQADILLAMSWIDPGHSLVQTSLRAMQQSMVYDAEKGMIYWRFTDARGLPAIEVERVASVMLAMMFLTPDMQQMDRVAAYLLSQFRGYQKWTTKAGSRMSFALYHWWSHRNKESQGQEQRITLNKESGVMQAIDRSSNGLMTTYAIPKRDGIEWRSAGDFTIGHLYIKREVSVMEPPLLKGDDIRFQVDYVWVKANGLDSVLLTQAECRALPAGSKVLLRAQVETAHAMDWVHMTLAKPAYLRDIQPFSGMMWWERGRGYVHPQRESVMMYVSHLTSGRHEIWLPFVVEGVGRHTSGVSRLEGMYEFRQRTYVPGQVLESVSALTGDR
jgi:hypothetical protein